MNKAFVREPEEHGDRCPRCGTAGQAVFDATLAAHVSADVRERIGDAVCFCPHPTCQVAYFDRFERTIETSGLRHAVYPKDPQAPLCPCFGLTRDEVEAEARDGAVEQVREHRRKAESSEAHCATAAPDGRSCIPAVQKCYMQARTHSK